MASSQADCANLFLPLLKYPVEAARVLRAVKSDLQWIGSIMAINWCSEPVHFKVGLINSGGTGCLA